MSGFGEWLPHVLVLFAFGISCIYPWRNSLQNVLWACLSPSVRASLLAFVSLISAERNVASYHLSVSIPICHTLQPPQDVYGSQTTACQTPRDSQNQVGGLLGPAQKTTRKIIWIFSFMICSFWHAKVYNTVEPVNTDMDQIVLQNLQFNIEDAYILETWNTYFMKNIFICSDNVISYISI